MQLPPKSEYNTELRIEDLQLQSSITLDIRRAVTRSGRGDVGCMPWFADIKAVSQS